MERRTVEISTAQIRELRARTGAGIVDCRTALQQAEGDLDRAAEILRAKGLLTAQKKAGRTALEGLVEAYIHTGGKVGAMVEVNCETDFVARTEEFRRLCRDLAMQVAASAPRYVSREEVPPDVIAEQRRLIAAELGGTPPAAVESRLNQWFQEEVLLEQPFIRDTGKTVRDLVTEAVARLGENIQIRRFARFKIGE
ncbi:MAG: translation elongation factor Ts [Armatimonadota bacterium]|nr:translation elongation factor Ts [Armatimonadota bacterium]MDR7451573.1 translation elongation factor Ts [Armatimonadota bacterium]MDR7467707.1 translation elongation factor Ts [Armatimonadota bacterium]MDR7492542.1 translation elongation factor Ts [Armatimonadota bacterium]MDR7500584.1 translation elongation factor Ts [Armatimonadota bacterium]